MGLSGRKIIENINKGRRNENLSKEINYLLANHTENWLLVFLRALFQEKQCLLFTIISQPKLDFSALLKYFSSFI